MTPREANYKLRQLHISKRYLEGKQRNDSDDFVLREINKQIPALELFLRVHPFIEQEDNPQREVDEKNLAAIGYRL